MFPTINGCWTEIDITRHLWIFKSYFAAINGILTEYAACIVLEIDNASRLVNNNLTFMIKIFVVCIYYINKTMKFNLQIQIDSVKKIKHQYFR